MTLRIGIICLLFALTILRAAPVEGAAKMNVILILADDLGWSDLGCYGADLHETPRLDRFAESGVRFTQAYSASPVCTPTRASILTGKHPARLHMTIWHEASQNPPQDRKLIPPIAVGNLPLKEYTLAEAFHDAGYETAHFGKWHLGTGDFYPETQGFDWNIGGTHWGAPATFFYPYRGKFHDEIRYVPGLAGGQPGEYLTDRLTHEALEFIERPRTQPFFLNLSYYSVHTPIEAPEEDVEAFRKKIHPGFHHQNPTYAAMVHRLDHNVGRILDKIDALGMTENTVVIFASDNGGYINEYRDKGVVTSNAPLRSGKGSLYEGGIRIPLMVRAPGLTPQNRTCQTPVSTVDFFPTLLDVAGVDSATAEEGLRDGISLVSLLKNPESSLAERPLFFHYPHYYFAPKTAPVSAIRKGDWKLLEHFEDERVELFDLGNDPSESENLSPSRPEIAAELLDELKEWRKAVGAQVPVGNPNFVRN